MRNDHAQKKIKPDLYPYANLKHNFGEGRKSFSILKCANAWYTLFETQAKFQCSQYLQQFIKEHKFDIKGLIMEKFS